jgi:hypothetical protein
MLDHTGNSPFGVVVRAVPEALPLLPFYTDLVRTNYGISVDATHVYFITQAQGQRDSLVGLLRVPKPPNP